MIFRKMLLIGLSGSVVLDILCMLSNRLDWIGTLTIVGIGLLFEGQCIALGLAWSDMETYRQKKGRKVWL